ncbi:MAG: hypothetical protein ACYSX0_18580 [Planctomycetota bacterium]
MTDNMSHTPLSRKLGRGFARALAGIFGRRNLKKAQDSLDVLAEEYRAGKWETDEEEAPPRRISHREIEPLKGSSEPPPAS